MKFVRFLRGATLANAALYAILGLLAYPAFRAGDVALWAATAVIAVGSGLLAAVRDETSHALKEGEDRGSEILLSLLVLAGIATAAVDLGRLPSIPGPPGWLRWLGVGAVALGYGVRTYAFSVNAFFAGVITVQRDRGHRVIDSGPYGWVRHPGYAALVPLFVGLSLALGSYLALVPFSAAIAVMVRRTSREDHFLHAHLEGYPSYASRVRYRLFPSVW